MNKEKEKRSFSKRGMHMPVLEALRNEFEQTRQAVHNGEIEASLPKFKALYKSFINLEAYEEAMKCFTQQMLAMYNIGEVTRAFQMLSEYEMLCEQYDVEKVRSDYYPLLSVQYNVLGEHDEAKRYMYEGSQYALEHENYTAYFSQRTLYVDVIVKEGLLEEARKEVAQMASYGHHLARDNAFILNISSLQCQLAAAFEDDVLFQEAKQRAEAHPLIQQRKAVRQVCNYFYNATTYYQKTKQYRRAYELIQINLHLLVTCQMTTLERHVLEQYTMIADRAGEMSWQVDAYKRLVKVLMREVDENLNEELAKRKAQELREQAERDALTNCYNRHYLTKEVNALLRANEQVHMAVFDCDFFKDINDTYGHLAGDLVLKQIVSCAQENLPANSFISRYGGDEFVVVIYRMDGREYFEQLFSCIHGAEVTYENTTIKLSISMGITASRQGDVFDTLFQRADAAVYKAKQSGKGRFAY